VTGQGVQRLEADEGGGRMSGTAVDVALRLISGRSHRASSRAPIRR